jgi:hypothetical protein
MATETDASILNNLDGRLRNAIHACLTLAACAVLAIAASGAVAAGGIGHDVLYAVKDSDPAPIKLHDFKYTYGLLARSPDGRSLAFTGRDIFVMGADGSKPMRVTSNGDSHHSLAWSADSSLIAYDGCTTNCVGPGTIDRIRIVNLRTRAVTTFPIPMTHAPALSKRGTFVAFLPTNGIGALHVARADGSDDNVITATAPGVSGDWSPTDDLLVYAERLPHRTVTYFRYGIRIYDPHSHTRRPISIKGSATSPIWSPDGHRIAYIWSDAIDVNDAAKSKHHLVLQLRVVDVATGRSTVITKGRGFTIQQFVWGGSNTLVYLRYPPPSYSRKAWRLMRAQVAPAAAPVMIHREPIKDPVYLVSGNDRKVTFVRMDRD